MTIKKNFQSANKAQNLRFFHFSNLLQMPNNHRMVDVEFFGNFLCSYKRISFDDAPQLVIANF